MSNYLPHQISKGDEVAATLKKHGVCYLAGEVRSGKTRAALHALGQLPIKRAVLWVTKKQAISGIEREINAVQPSFEVYVTNYEQLGKLDKSLFSVVVVDEAHNLATCGKPTQRIKSLRAIAFDLPVLLLSGTPSVETALGLYHQFCVTKYTPLKYKNFFEFFRLWGIPSPMYMHGRLIEQYKQAKPALLPALEPYFVRMTQVDAGITALAEDVVHSFTLDKSTIALIQRIKADGVITVGGREVVFENDASIRMAIHQVEAGALLVDNGILHLDNTEMVDFIRDTFGDLPDVAVMCHFRSTREKVSMHLPNVHIYSSDGHSEGVDLSHYRAFVIANSGYSGAKFVQRRDRATRLDVTTPRRVNHLLVKGQLSEKVYRAISIKRDFNLAMFRRECLA